MTIGRNVMKNTNGTKLTSVKVIEDLYNKFKKQTIDNDFNLQKLVNRSIYKYVTDENWQGGIHTEESLLESGSCF
tara:strand:+ start:187 stop:411 length:225 start_codon:yes stop_codon:yes gene_type:complete